MSYLYGSVDLKDLKRLEYFEDKRINSKTETFESIKKPYKDYGKLGKDIMLNTYKLPYNNNKRQVKYEGDKQIDKGRRKFETSRFKTDLPHIKKDQKMIRII